MAMQVRKDTFMPYGISKEINGNDDHFRTDCAEMEEETGLAKRFEPQDEYISSEKSGKEPTGLYRVGRNENGSRKIFFDDPKAAHVDERKEWKAGEAGKGPKADGNSQGKPEEICVGNTDKVDQEIKKLKEKKQELERQIQSASGNAGERKIQELEKKLAQVEQELSQKDNDTYRKQHSVFSRIN